MALLSTAISHSATRAFDVQAYDDDMADAEALLILPDIPENSICSSFNLSRAHKGA